MGKRKKPKKGSRKTTRKERSPKVASAGASATSKQKDEAKEAPPAATTARSSALPRLLLVTITALAVVAALLWWRFGGSAEAPSAVATSESQLGEPSPGPNSGPAQVPEIASLAELDPRMRESVEQAVRGVKERPGDGAAWGKLGRVYHAHKYFALALEAYEEAARLAPATADWWYYLGLLRAERGANSEAIASFRKALDAESQRGAPHVETQFHLGQALIAHGDLEAAEQVFEALAKQHEGWGALGLGRVALRRDDPEAAVGDLERAVAALGDDRQSHYLLATAKRELGRRDEARQHFAKANQLERRLPADPRLEQMAGERRDLQALIQAANRLLEEGAAERAEELYREVLRHDETHFDAHYNLAVLSGRAGRNQEALEHIERALEQSPEEAKAWRARGIALMELGRQMEALAAFEKALELNPADEQLRRMLQGPPPGA